jgi:hypothetical protein
MNAWCQLNQVLCRIVYRSENQCNARIAKKGPMPIMTDAAYRITTSDGKKVAKTSDGGCLRSSIPVVLQPHLDRRPDCEIVYQAWSSTKFMLRVTKPLKLSHVINTALVLADVPVGDAIQNRTTRMWSFDKPLGALSN